MDYLITTFKTLLGRRKKYDISTFFFHESKSEQERVLREVAKKANQDQKALVDQYEKLYPNGV